VIDRDLRRALAFIVPYWRRLVLVLLLSALSTGLSLYLPLLSRDFFDHALIGRDLRTLIRVGALFALFSAASFVVNVVSGLRYTRVSADILFDMRLQMYRHLQRLSPRFHARTRIGDVMSGESVCEVIASDRPGYAAGTSSAGLPNRRPAAQTSWSVLIRSTAQTRNWPANGQTSTRSHRCTRRRGCCWKLSRRATPAGSSTW